MKHFFQIPSAASFLQSRKDVIVVVLACLCVILPLDVSQLVFAIIGAISFSLLQSSKPKQRQVGLRNKTCSGPSTKVVGRTERIRPNSRPVPAPRCDVKRPSAAPVQAPKFESALREQQFEELLKQIAPSAADDDIVSKLANMIKHAVKPIFPDVEVVGFTSGDLSRKKAFGVAVPDVDIVANVNPVTLASALESRLGVLHSPTDSKKVQKSAIRLCTDRLVSEAGFKFRRSAFRGDEPKVTLLVPANSGLGVDVDAIPISFSVNAVTPLHNAALVTECGLLDPRARELILLIKRWAKDRGICHATKGHLCPYAWTTLCIFFLQAGMDAGEAVLPPLNGFKKASCLMRHEHGKIEVPVPSGSNKTTVELFSAFMQFYHEEFDWTAEVISIRCGQRGKPGLSLPLHIIVGENGKSTVGPSVENPFQEDHNLADAMTAESFKRLREELDRAHQFSLSSSSLAELLEPWAPPDADSTALRSENSIAPWRRKAC